MDIILAFLAFSATMIVFSTIATVVVEGIHKFSLQRRRDFDRMLTNYYQGAVKPLVEGAVEGEAQKFVNNIRRNPAFEGEKHDSRPSIASLLFDTSFQSLTTPQFIEQLSRSNVGEKIRELVAKGEKNLIEQLASEFERYGDAAHDYFHRRAQMLSLIVAILLALAVNVDAIRLFQALANDSELAETVSAQIDPDDWEAKYLALREVSEGNAQKFEDVVVKARDDIRSDIALLSGMSLPIGHMFYPWCSNSGLITETKASEDGRPVSVKRHVDARCDSHINNNGWTHLDRVSDELPFWIWILKAILSGLLIGLGAPFWFKTYRFLADFVPGINRGPKTQTREALNRPRETPQLVTTQPAVDLQQILVDEKNAKESKVVQELEILRSNGLNQRRLNTMFLSAGGKRIGDQYASNSLDPTLHRALVLL